MDKKASVELIILGLIAVIAIIGLVLLFKGGSTGNATGQPQTRQVFPNSEPFYIAQAGGYSCGCNGVCTYDNKVVRASPTIDAKMANAETTCRTMLESICGGQPISNFKFGCGTR